MSNIRDDRGYNQVWADGDASRIRAERRCDQMLRMMDLQSAVSIMEIGCGMGTNCFRMAVKSGRKVLGTDLCVPFVEAARERYVHPGLRYEVLDFNRADDFNGETFDYIVGNGILHHLYHDLERAFLNMSRLLKNGGKIIFYEPNLYNPYVYLIFSFAPLRKLAHLEPAEMAFSKPYIVEKLTKLAFRNIRVDFKDFLLPGIPSFLIKPSIAAGNILERLPVINHLAQSIFITAEK